MALSDYNRKILVAGEDLSTLITGCTFSFERIGGCASASLHLPGIAFNDLLGLKIDDPVKIYYNRTLDAYGVEIEPTDLWWQGLVSSLSSEQLGGLTIECIGNKTVLSHIKPRGRYGNVVVMAPITNPPTYELKENEGDIAHNTVNTYYVACYDEVGIALPDSWNDVKRVVTTPDEADTTYAIELTWPAHEKAHHYRVFKEVVVESVTYYYYELTRGTTFVDVGGVSKFSNAYETALPTEDTHAVAAKVEITTYTTAATVKHLLSSNGIPVDPADETVPELFVRDADVTGSELIDYLDLSKNAADVQRLMDTLRFVEGKYVWGVRSDRSFYFKQEALPESATPRLVFHEASGAASADGETAVDEEGAPILGAGDSTPNFVIRMSKTVSSDGITDIRVKGEQALENRNRSLYGHTTLAWENVNKSVHRSYTADSRTVFSGAITSASPNIEPKTRAFLDSYASLSDWLADFPNQAWLYRVKSVLSDAFIASALTSLEEKIRQRAAYDAEENPRRQRTGTRVLKAPGVRTTTLAGRIAFNKMEEVAPNIGKFALTVQNIDRIIRPGLDIIRAVTQDGVGYNLRVTSANYSFDSMPSVSFDAGDPGGDDMEEFEPETDPAEDINAETGVGGTLSETEPDDMEGEVLPSPNWIGNAGAIGTSSRFARQDHVHEFISAYTDTVDIVGATVADPDLAGTSTTPARADHSHHGMPPVILAATGGPAAALPTDTVKFMYHNGILWWAAPDSPGWYPLKWTS